MNQNSKSSRVSTTYVFEYPRSAPKSTWKDVIYNPSRGTYLTRTPASWGKIILFYIIFYTALAGLFAICLHTHSTIINEDKPYRILSDSTIGMNPGLGFRPLSPMTEYGSLMQIDTKDQKNISKWTNLVEDFFEPYKKKYGISNQRICDFNTTIPCGGVCAVDINSFGDCNFENSFGYSRAKPCVFLKLNKIYGWKPDYYSNINELPNNMPKDLKEHIKSLPEYERAQIWVSCSGQLQKDKEKIGDITYAPRRGFPSYYYPYENQKNYLSPLVAVQFTNIKLHEIVSIECKAWAKNIEYSGRMRYRKGSVLFEFIID